MDERPDLERYVEAESARVIASRSRYIAWPFWLRLLVALSVATPFVALGAGIFYLVVIGHEDESFGVWAALTLGFAFFAYAAAFVHAVSPSRSIRRSIRSSATYPTNAPGYPSWRENQRQHDGNGPG